MATLGLDGRGVATGGVAGAGTGAATEQALQRPAAEVEGRRRFSLDEDPACQRFLKWKLCAAAATAFATFAA